MPWKLRFKGCVIITQLKECVIGKGRMSMMLVRPRLEVSKEQVRKLKHMSKTRDSRNHGRLVGVLRRDIIFICLFVCLFA